MARTSMLFALFAILAPALGCGGSGGAVPSGGGTPPPSDALLTGTYTVAATGEVTVDLTSGISVQGTVLAGGDLVVLGGALSTGDSPWTLILVRETAFSTAATLAGPYFAVGLTWRLAADLYVVHTGTITSNGVDQLTLDLVEHEEGSITPPLSDTSAYTVAPDGRVTVTTSGGDTLEGGVSADGRFAMVSGGTNNTSDPQLWFLLK